MAIFRGVGGSGDSSDNSFLDAVTAQANSASASATSAANSLAAIQQTEVTSASFNTGDGVLTLTKTGGATVTADLDGRFLTSYTETNNLTTAVTWANVPDANITESSVTQYLTAANITSPLTGGTGISVASNGTITNDSPDQTVALTGTGATTITGTYPNFTINSVNTTYTVGDGGLTTNDFTDADHTKLDNIEASADVTDATNVTSAGAAMLASSPTFTGTVTAPNVDISTTGSVTTNIATGGAAQGSGTKILNLGTGYSTFADLTTVNIGTQHDSGQNLINVGSGVHVSGNEDTINLKGNVTVAGDITSSYGGITVGGSILVGGTVDGRDVAVDGTKLDTLEQTFTSRFHHIFPATTLLTTTLATIGYTYQAKETTGSKNTLDLTLETRHNDTYDTNDAEYYVSLTAPNPSDEDVVFLGNIQNVVSDTTKGKKIGYFTGDKTKYFSTYCGLATTSSGSSALNQNGLSYYYDATNDRTYMGVHLYQTNNFSTNTAIFVHPFDWETSGTVMNGIVTPLDAAVYDGLVDSVHTKKHYLGYFKSDVNLEIRAQEPSANTDGNNVAIRVVEGNINQVQD